MKRASVIILALGLALSACASGENIGGGVNRNLQTPPPTDSPTPTKKAETKKAEPTKKPEPTKKVERPIQNYDLVIRNPGEGFRPDSIRLVQGDTITFINEDPNNDHQLIIHKGDKEIFTGKELSNGEKQKITVDFEAGEYGYKDGAVPYILGGVLEVLRVA